MQQRSWRQLPPPQHPRLESHELEEKTLVIRGRGERVRELRCCQRLGQRRTVQGSGRRAPPRHPAARASEHCRLYKMQMQSSVDVHEQEKTSNVTANQVSGEQQEDSRRGEARRGVNGCNSSGLLSSKTRSLEGGCVYDGLYAISNTSPRELRPRIAQRSIDT